MASLQIPRGVTPAQIGHARRTINVDGVTRDVSAPWRGVVQMGTDLAEQLWAMRGGNPRPFSKHVATKYADEIRSGAWGMVYPSEIIITSDGVLGNGQHRVAAVLATGLRINVELVLGVDRAALEFMDCGRPRSLNIRKTLVDDTAEANKYAVMLAGAMVKLATSHTSVSGKDLEKVDAVYHDSLAYIGGRISRMSHKRGVGRAGPCAALVQYHHADQDGAILFMDSFFVPGGDVQPAVMLRDYMLTHVGVVGGQNMIMEYERACSAIAAAMRGEVVKHLKRRNDHPCGPIKFARARSANLDWSFV